MTDHYWSKNKLNKLKKKSFSIIGRAKDKNRNFLLNLVTMPLLKFLQIDINTIFLASLFYEILNVTLIPKQFKPYRRTYLMASQDST